MIFSPLATNSGFQNKLRIVVEGMSGRVAPIVREIEESVTWPDITCPDVVMKFRSVVAQ